MEFAFTEDQTELRAIVAAFLAGHASSDTVRAAALEGDGFAREPWARLVGEMELTGLAIGLDRGGSGASFVEVGIALEELGRTLLPVPYLPTVVAAAALGGADATGAAAEALERIAGGAVATVALADPAALRGGGAAPALDGEVGHVLDAAHAEIFVCAAELDGEPTLVAVDRGAAGVEVDPATTLDQTRRQGTLRLEGAPARALVAPGAGGAALLRGRDVASVALALEAVGAAARCLEVTVEYLGERVQFGRPIGSFQALKHRCADLVAELEAARSTAYYASWAVDAAPEELPSLAPLAAAVGNDALLHVAGESIQLHGGIGFTWEHDAHLYFKRAKATDLLGGGSRALRDRAAERAGILEVTR
ncbi:MAG: acyl-CoA dehydrogenase family protein [Solirubrobacterales bacterium]